MPPIAPIGVAAPALPPTAPAPTARSFGAALRAHTPAAPAGPTSTSSVARVALGSVERARQRLDAVLSAARQGRTFSAQELLALQADAYRYSQALDIAAKVVEQGAQAVKQAVHTQV